MSTEAAYIAEFEAIMRMVPDPACIVRKSFGRAAVPTPCDNAKMEADKALRAAVIRKAVILDHDIG